RLLQRLRSLTPDDANVLTELAYSLINLDRQTEAIPIVKKLVTLPNAPQRSWRLLGYVGLWEKPPDAAIEASKKYLALVPDSTGAMMNLAFGYGIKGPSDTEAKSELIPLLKKLKERDPDQIEAIKKKDDFDADFKLWMNDPEFREVVFDE